MCRSRGELSNAYFLAKVGFDTAENEPCKVCPIDDAAGRTVPTEVLPPLASRWPTREAAAQPRLMYGELAVAAPLLK